MRFGLPLLQGCSRGRHEVGCSGALHEPDCPSLPLLGWATPPDGSYTVLTALLNADGEAIGELQEFALHVEGEQVEVTPTVEVEFELSVEDLGLSVNDCGDGKLNASVAGEGAADVASRSSTRATP